MIKRIDHVGIVVSNISESLQVLSDLFGFKATASPVDSKSGEYRTLTLCVGDALVELIEPMDPDGSIAKFLKQRGAGLHHISFQVEDISKALKSLKAKGVRLINEEPTPVAIGRAAFVHPHSTKGILVELLERL